MEHMQMSNRGPHRRLNKRLNYGLKFVFVLSLSMFQQLFPSVSFKISILQPICFCLRPENRPSVFAVFCIVICWGAGGGVWGGGGL